MGKLSHLPSRIGGLPNRLESDNAGPKSRTQRRNENAPWRAWYRTSRWQALRLKVLKRDHWICAATGQIVSGKYPAANSAVVDHKIPHRGDPILFWDENNLQVLSKEYHDKDKQIEEQKLR